MPERIFVDMLLKYTEMPKLHNSITVLKNKNKIEINNTKKP